ncbi:MAG TPA: TRAP transporter small permease subunit [Aestuariivirga sp.]|nr:TRAP transporter small permease subunit [Aestuariivirga sp.]
MAAGKGEVMQALLGLSRAIDAVSRFIGHHVRWLVLAAVLISAINAVMRKFFDLSSNAWLELQWLLFGAVFMLAASLTLQRNAHIRIDVLSSRWSKRTRDWIDLFGHLVMLAPLTLVMIWLTGPAFLESWHSGERSVNAGGLAVWPAKFLIFAGFLLLFLQMISEVIKRIAVLRGVITDPEPVPVHGHDPADVSPGGAHAE